MSANGVTLRLEQQQCRVCKPDAPGVSNSERADLIRQLSNWEIDEGKEIPQLLKVYNFPDFMQALAFANKVGELAEKEGHHPALLIEWGRVTVRWWTHKILGLHRNDFIMASKTDAIFTNNL